MMILSIFDNFWQFVFFLQTKMSTQRVLGFNFAFSFVLSLQLCEYIVLCASFESVDLVSSSWTFGCTCTCAWTRMPSFILALTLSLSLSLSLSTPREDRGEEGGAPVEPDGRAGWLACPPWRGLGQLNIRLGQPHRKHSCPPQLKR